MRQCEKSYAAKVCILLPVINVADPSAPYRLNLLAKKINAKRYLEIGVQTGQTFANVAVPDKTAVDPDFRFDYLSDQDPLHRYHEVCSDVYFSGLENPDLFDLVFIDGLHTYDQAYRDFCNSLVLTSGLSIIVLGDTEPADLYSSLRSQAVCELRRSREAPGSAVAEWRGDVYKIPLFLKLFHSSLEYCTVTGDGPAQTVVWRRNILPREAYDSAPFKISPVSSVLFEYLGAVNRLDFTWLLENIYILQKCSFASFCDWFQPKSP